MKIFRVVCDYVFSGDYYVLADDDEDATDTVFDVASWCNGASADTTKDAYKQNKINWEFDTHPDFQILETMEIPPGHPSYERLAQQFNLDEE